MDHARRYHRPAAAGREALRVAMAGSIALICAACSLSFPMTSLVNEEPGTTDAVTPKAASPLLAELGEEDWRRAKAALAVALDPQGSGSQVSWDNPDTTLKGAFTPVGQPFVKNDEICRSFMAHVTGQGVASSLQGTACRPSGGEWVIKDTKPAKEVASSQDGASKDGASKDGASKDGASSKNLNTSKDVNQDKPVKDIKSSKKV